MEREISSAREQRRGCANLGEQLRGDVETLGDFGQVIEALLALQGDPSPKGSWRRRIIQFDFHIGRATCLGWQVLKKRKREKQPNAQVSVSSWAIC